MKSQTIETVQQNAKIDRMTATLDQFVTVSEAANIIGVSVQRVHAYIRGDRPRLSRVFRAGRYELSRDEVEKFAATARKTGRPKKSSDCS